MADHMIYAEILKQVFALVDEKVTLQEEREKVIRGIMDILNAEKGLVSIDLNDVRDLFQEGSIIHTFDVSVDALKKKRMKLLMNLIIENTKKYGPFSHALVFFFFPNKRPLLMEELQPFSDWIESIPRELRIKWGMATQSEQELRAIVILQ